ncbi:hypothetical protein V1478_008073, partial [Vespula squamosa]
YVERVSALLGKNFLRSITSKIDSTALLDVDVEGESLTPSYLIYCFLSYGSRRCCRSCSSSSSRGKVRSTAKDSYQRMGDMKVPGPTVMYLETI